MKTILAGVALCFTLAAPSWAAEATVTVARDVAYGALPRQKLDIYTPSEPLPGAPVLVFFYGGGWRTGDKAEIAPAAETLARAGIIVVTPDYRLFPQATFPAFVEDSALATAWAWRNLRTADGKPRPLFVGGHSAGAYNAAMVALDQSYLAADDVPVGAVKGFIGLAGPYLRWGRSGFDEIFPAATRARAAVIDFVDRNDPPMLLIYGDADRVVVPLHSRTLAAAASAAGIDVAASAYPGLDHLDVYTALKDGASQIARSVEAFIARHAGD